MNKIYAQLIEDQKENKLAEKLGIAPETFSRKKNMGTFTTAEKGYLAFILKYGSITADKTYNEVWEGEKHVLR